MADLLEFSATAQGTVQVNVPRYTIAAKVVESGDQSQVIADFTGANALVFPNVLLTLTQQQRDTLLSKLWSDIISIKAGIV